jgi:hypothetical protein
MSFFDDASLAFLPSSGAGKDGKAYSIKPTTGDGDFTFSRGSNLAATRVGADGLIEKGRENLLTYSNQFDTTWTTSSASVTSGQSGYNGSNDAWLLQSTATTTSMRLQQGLASSSILAYSVYAKSGTTDWLILRNSSSATAVWFDLANGVIGQENTDVIDSSIESVGDGWYRLSVVFNSCTSVRLYLADGDNSFAVTLGASILIQDAQLEIGLAATDYIESGATTGKAGLLEDEPRFDYSGGATCGSLLLEPSRTNLVPYSEYFNDASWAKVGSSVTPNATTSPDGTINASKLVEDTSTGGHQIQSIISASNSTIYTTSVFVKYAGREWIRFTDAQSSNRIHFNTLTGAFGTITGTVIDYNKTDLENEWYKLSFTTTSVATAYTPRIALSEADNDVSYTGDGTSGVYIWGAQLEVGYPTSYIPNHSGGSVTRGADKCEDAGDVNTFNSTEGVLYLEASAIDNGGSEKALAINDGSTNNRINIRIVGNFIRAYGIVGGSLVCLMTYTAPSVTSINKIAFKYKENDFALWVNGVERVTDTSGSVFPPNTLNELSFDYGGPSAFFNGNVKQVLVFKEALSDADLATLTTL